MVHRFDMTGREYEISSLIAAGASDLDLCEALGVRLPAVKARIRNCFDKLGVDSRAGLTALLLRPELWPQNRLACRSWHRGKRDARTKPAMNGIR